MKPTKRQIAIVEHFIKRETKRIMESDTTSDPILELDKKIMKLQPNTIKDLTKILNDSGMKFKIEKIQYLGYPQGVKVKIKHNGLTRTIPGNGLVYSVFKD